MGYSIAKCKTKYGTQVRVIQHIHYKSKYIKTIGTARDPLDLNTILLKARKYIDTLEHNLWAEPVANQPTTITNLDNFTVVKILSTPLFRILEKIYNSFNLPIHIPELFKHLVILRIIEPKSKMASVELLKQHFDFDYTLDQIYYLKRDKNISRTEILKSIFSFAENTFDAELSLVFYDVTTLYFESFTEDELKQFGFSKDHKFNQSQIVIGLLVNNQGFPLYYEIYEGSTFEGKTFIPSIKDFMKILNVQNLTVVADAAMMSRVNFQELEDAQLKYIIGARVANLPLESIKSISNTLNQLDLKTCRLKTNQTQQIQLITQYSAKRATKDTFDLKKQLDKAQGALLANKTTKSTKFLKRVNKEDFELNTSLIHKTELLVGVKGYYTNLTEISDEEVVLQYANLWRIEHNFRVSKTDLEIRPIYHWKSKGIEFHVLLNFVALAVSRYIELTEKTSINSFVKELMKKKEVVIRNNDTRQLFILK